MKKLVFVFLAVLFFSCTESHVQSDFYGTWVNTENGNKMEYAITGTIFTSTYTPRNPTLIAPIERNTFEIFSWEKIANEDADTKGDYPTGFLIGLRSGLGYTTVSFFMHRNKNSLVSAYEYKGSYRKDVYVKQGNATSTAKPSQQELFNFISELTDNFPSNEEQAIKRFIARDFLLDNRDGTYVRMYDDKVKAVAYGDYPDLYNNNMIHFILVFDNEAEYKTTLLNLTSYLSKKYNEQSHYSDISNSYSYTYFGSAVIFIMDGKGIYDGFTIVLSIG